MGSNNDWCRNSFAWCIRFNNRQGSSSQRPQSTPWKTKGRTSSTDLRRASCTIYHLASRRIPKHHGRRIRLNDFSKPFCVPKNRNQVDCAITLIPFSISFRKGYKKISRNKFFVMILFHHEKLLSSHRYLNCITAI